MFVCVILIEFKKKTLKNSAISALTESKSREPWICKGVKLKRQKLLFLNLGDQNRKFVKVGGPKVHFVNNTFLLYPQKEKYIFFLNPEQHGIKTE